ncbi:hypothetical protein C0993_004016 [Termitomyces sp. T159_Od127]|nr:hypothetical protein C0993_004016 [Termitomyces sp. T159_Od127]
MSSFDVYHAYQRQLLHAQVHRLLSSALSPQPCRSPRPSPPSSPSPSSSNTPQASPSPSWPLSLTGHLAGTMFELVKDLNDGARVLNTRSSNPISLNAGCELFITFVTLFPHDSVSFADLKTKLIRQGQQYAEEALTYRQKIAELAAGFIKDGSVVCVPSSAIRRC